MMLKYSTSLRTAAKWKRCTVSALSLYLALAVLLLPGNELEQLWRLPDSIGIHHLKGLQNIAEHSVSNTKSLLVEAVAAAAETVAATSQEAASSDCTPLGEMLATRFNRASPQSNLRMLRGGGGRRAIESLIKTHNNCLLMSDRVRFKKSGPVGSSYQLRGEYNLGESIAPNEAYKDHIAETLKGLERMAVLFGWRRLDDGEGGSRIALTPIGLYTLQSVVRSNFKDN